MRRRCDGRRTAFQHRRQRIFNPDAAQDEHGHLFQIVVFLRLQNKLRQRILYFIVRNKTKRLNDLQLRIGIAVPQRPEERGTDERIFFFK